MMRAADLEEANQLYDERLTLLRQLKAIQNSSGSDIFSVDDIQLDLDGEQCRLIATTLLDRIETRLTALGVECEPREAA